MKIKPLTDVSLADIIQCLLESFKEYAVKMPYDLPYWKHRFHAASVDYSLSYGAFHNEQLVAFIIHGIDNRNGAYVAFNTGTGVIEAYRGNHLVDKLYAVALPELRKKGVEKCQLEVIESNYRAIAVYKRMGFEIVRNLMCYNGRLKEVSIEAKISPVAFNSVKQLNYAYAWDNSNEAVQMAGETYNSYQVYDEQNDPVGFFVINEANGQLFQLESNEEKFDYMVSGIRQIIQKVKFNNVDEQRTSLNSSLIKAGLANVINQYEMEMALK